MIQEDTCSTRGRRRNATEDVLFQNLSPLASLAPLQLSRLHWQLSQPLLVSPRPSLPPPSSAYRGSFRSFYLNPWEHRGLAWCHHLTPERGTQLDQEPAAGSGQLPLCCYPIGSLNAMVTQPWFLLMDNLFSTGYI